MSGWPSTSFSFRALSPPTFVELRALYDGLYVCGGIQICRDVTYSIVVNFLECLTKQSPTNLKYVDISGYPTGEIIYIQNSRALAMCSLNMKKQMLLHFHFR